MRLDHQTWLALLGAAGALAALVFVGIALWRRHRMLGWRYDRERERVRRAYWGFE
jgi:hypothetical protein